MVCLFFRISVTTDRWTSINSDAYLSLTAHYITEDWALVTKCLCTHYAPDNIASFVKDMVHKYGLRMGNIVSITTDSAANVIAAARKLGRCTSLRNFKKSHNLNNIFLHDDSESKCEYLGTAVSAQMLLPRCKT